MRNNRHRGKKKYNERRCERKIKGKAHLAVMPKFARKWRWGIVLLKMRYGNGTNMAEAKEKKTQREKENGLWTTLGLSQNEGK